MQSFDKLLGQIIDETTSRSKGQQTQKGDIIAVGTSNVKLNLESISQAVKNILSKAIKPAIIEGLNVVATVPPSMKVYIYPGYGTSGGEIHELYDRVTATISPYIELQYINLKGARVTVDTSPVRGSLGLAKIAVPKPPYTNKILDDMNPASDYDGYIISGKDILFNNNFLIDDESIPVIRNTMSKIFAEYIFGTITLSEALKIANVQGTMMANSNSITFYDTNGAELAYYGAREARIGNIKITPTTVQSRNFQAGSRGFQLKDDGNAEFDNITARGTIYASAGDITGNLYVGTGSPRILIDGVAKTIGTTDFASGYNGRGWRIDADGSITMQNGLFRGELHTSVFVKDEVHVTNGNLMVTNGSVIASGVDSGDTDIYINQGVFSVNDIIRLKNDTNSEYMQVTGVTGADSTKITVTRNLDATGANDWEQGECVASLGSRINIAASGDITRSGFSGTEGYLPYVDVIRRNSTTWNDETVMVRMGNLTGINHALFGTLSGYGLFAQNVYLSGTMTASTIQTTNAANLGLKLTETGIKAWDSGNNQRVQILNDGSGWIGESEGKGISWTNAGKLTVSGTVGTTVIDGGNISTNSILITKLASDTTNRLFTDSTTKGNIEAWRHASDTTLIDGGDIYTNSVTADKISVTNLSAISANLGVVKTGIISGTTALNIFAQYGFAIWGENNNEVFTVSSPGNIRMGDVEGSLYNNLFKIDLNPPKFAFTNSDVYIEDGKLGIGISSSAGDELHVQAADNTHIQIKSTGGNSQAALRLINDAATYSIEIDDLGGVQGDSFYIRYNDAAVPSIAVTNGGTRVGIGLGDPDAKLEVDGAGIFGGCVTDGTCEIFTEDALEIIKDIMHKGTGKFDKYGHEHFDMERLHKKYPYLIEKHKHGYGDKLGAKSDLLYRATMQLEERIKKLEEMVN